jgi:hypothetical protein
MKGIEEKKIIGAGILHTYNQFFIQFYFTLESG